MLDRNMVPIQSSASQRTHTNPYEHTQTHTHTRTHTQRRPSTRLRRRRRKEGRERRLSSRLRPTHADANITNRTTSRERERMKGTGRDGRIGCSRRVLKSCAPFCLCLSFVAPSLALSPSLCLCVCGWSRWSAAIGASHWDELDPSLPFPSSHCSTLRPSLTVVDRDHCVEVYTTSSVPCAPRLTISGNRTLQWARPLAYCVCVCTVSSPWLFLHSSNSSSLENGDRLIE